MTFWEKNSAVLKQQYGGLLDQLNSADDDFPYEIKIETASAGDPTLNINGLYIHSPRDPVREGQRLAQAVEADGSPVVILGFGLGYAAQYAIKLGHPVIIVEKNIKLLRQALELRDLTDFLSAKNIIFVAGGTGDGIVNALSIVNELNKNDDAEKPIPAIIRNRALIELDNEWYKNVEDKIRTFSMKDKVNTATLKRFGKRWVRNISRNMSALRDLPGVSRFENLAHDNVFPVFLAAAGPGLDKIKPLLHDIYNRCIIIAVDTNLRFFTRNGIQPDFVLTVDPQFWNSRHLDRCNHSDAVCDKTTLIVESAIYPSVLHLPFKRKFICGSLFPLSLFIEKQVDPKGRLGAGGSVATTAWDFSRMLACSFGSNEIWIAGLDLAFPENKTHFRGARFEDRANSESCRFSPVETWVARSLRDGIPFKAKSSTGSQVLTDSRLSLYAAWFENQFSQHKNIRNLALFREGLAINGLQAANAEDLLALPVLREEIDAHLDAVYAQIDAEFYNEEEVRKRSGRYDNAVTSLISGLNGIKKTAEEGIKIVRSYTPSNDQKNVTKELDRITQKIADSEVKEIVSFLLPIENKKEEATSARSCSVSDPFRAYLQSSLNLFLSLSESAEFYLRLPGSIPT